MTGAIDMGSQKITTTYTPTNAADLTTKTYVDGILGSATAASASAAAAATSEANAATSETNASNSASAAATSETNTATLYDNFDDRYLGAKATAPTVDNDGDALITGALYFNTTTNIMNVYGTSGWQSAGSAVNGTSDRQTYTATSGQTVFAATYDTGYVDVYLNGVKLLAGTDFTATNGTSITLASGAAVNDIVDIVAYGTFVLADHYSKSQSDARYVEVAGDTMTGNLSFGDNDKAIFGAGSDLEVYHDGSNSRILENGTGFLAIGTNGGEISLRGDSFNDYMLKAEQNSAVTLYHNALPKLATTSTGIDVTGTVTADGLNVSAASPNIDVSDTGTSYASQDFLTNSSTVRATIGVERSTGGGLFVGSSPYAAVFGTASSGTTQFATNNNVRMTLDGSGNVGIGTSSPSAKLDLQGTAAGDEMLEITHSGASQPWKLISGESGVTNESLRISRGASGEWMRFHAGVGTVFSYDDTERMRIDSSGNVGINETSPDTKLHVSNSTPQTPIITVENPSVHEATIRFKTAHSADSDFRVGASISASNNFEIYSVNAATARLVINSSGNVGIGTTSPSDKLSVNGDVSATNFNTTSDVTLKTNVETLTGSLDAVKAMRGVSYDWIENGNSEVGVIAQEVEEVIPDVVSTNDQGIKSVKYGNLVGVLIEAIKEQQAQIDELKAQLNS